MGKFLYFCDAHYTGTPPASRTEDYGARILAKIEYVAKLAQERQVDAVLFGGDLFHGKKNVLYREAFAMMETLAAFRCPIYSIWGNHDASASTGIEYRAYGMVSVAGTLLVDCDAERRKNKPISVGGVRIIGRGCRNEDGDPASLIPPAKLKGKKKEPVVYLTHSMLFLKDTDAPFEHINLSQVEGQTARVVCCAHVHDHQGAVEKDGCLYVSPGGLGRVSRTEVDREVHVTLIEVDADGATCEFIPIPAEGGFLDESRADSFSGDDARSAAAAMMLPEGRDLRAEVDAALAAAAGELKHGEEVLAEARAYVRKARGE